MFVTVLNAMRARCRLELFSERDVSHVAHYIHVIYDERYLYKLFVQHFFLFNFELNVSFSGFF